MYGVLCVCVCVTWSCECVGEEYPSLQPYDTQDISAVSFQHMSQRKIAI